MKHLFIMVMYVVLLLTSYSLCFGNKFSASDIVALYSQNSDDKKAANDVTVVVSHLSQDTANNSVVDSLFYTLGTTNNGRLKYYIGITLRDWAVGDGYSKINQPKEMYAFRKFVTILNGRPDYGQRNRLFSNVQILVYTLKGDLDIEKEYIEFLEHELKGNLHKSNDNKEGQVIPSYMLIDDMAKYDKSNVVSRFKTYIHDTTLPGSPFRYMTRYIETGDTTAIADIICLYNQKGYLYKNGCVNALAYGCSEGTITENKDKEMIVPILKENIKTKEPNLQYIILLAAEKIFSPDEFYDGCLKVIQNPAGSGCVEYAVNKLGESKDKRYLPYLIPLANDSSYFSHGINKDTNGKFSVNESNPVREAVRKAIREINSSIDQ